MQGPGPKVKDSKKVPVTKSQALTCENGRIGVVPDVVQQMNAPVPRTAAPVQVQDVTATVRAPKDRAIKEDEASVSVDLLFPAFGNEMFVLPEGEEDIGVQADVIRALQTLELLLALQARFAVIQHCDKLHLSEVKLVTGAGIRLIFQNAPVVPDELLRIEVVTVDGNDL
ncbi:hypothetical protein BK005_00570 [bacterium CG10_37_50]|nr:MAG: hypothetical protein BK005_00570 [bacterium CG10_37_50]